MSNYCVVMTTVSSDEDAIKVINAVLESKLAACVQTTSIGSHYEWNGELCHDKEILILFKTSWRLYEELEAKLSIIHPYETPEIIALDIEKGAKKYFDWIDEVT